MNIIYKTPEAENRHIAYETSGNKITLGDDELTLNLSKYEQVSVPNPFKGADVIFRSTKNLEEFRLLELASGKSVYSKDLLMADEKLVLHLESLETIPKNGISFKDDAGRERRFAILQSGKDGSIYLQESE